MNSQDVKKFPFEFQSLHPEETEELKKNFGATFEFARVGPKGYILSADYEDDAENIYNMPLRSDDVIVYSFPRSEKSGNLLEEGPAGIVRVRDTPVTTSLVEKCLSRSMDSSVVLRGSGLERLTRLACLSARFLIVVCNVNGVENTYLTNFDCSFGTTWTQELVWLIMKDLDYEAARSTNLTQRYTFLEFPSMFTRNTVDKILEWNTFDGIQKDIENLKQFSRLSSEVLTNSPSPRFIKTHLPLSFLPPTTLDTAKVVYVARDPRDAAVSFYYLCQMTNYINYKGDFKTFWNLFKKNLILQTPFFEHLKEAWALRHHPNMLFLFYEELSRDLPSTVRRVADFFGKQLSEEQVAGLCDHLSFKNFKKNDSVNISELKGFGAMKPNTSFIRKGKAGGWRDYFDEQMSQAAERWIEHHLRDTDLRFPHHV